MPAQNNPYRKGLDWPTIILYVLLVGFGWSNLYAANYNPEVGLTFNFSAEYFKQLVWIGISIVFGIAIIQSDSKLYVEAAIPIYAVSLLLLTAVLFIGKEVYGAKSWLAIGPIQFQPAEFTKIGAALVIARIMSRYGFKFELKSYFHLFAIIFIPVIYILLQNDTGSALVYFVFLLPMFREGLTPHLLLIGGLCVVAAVASLLAGTFPAMIGLVVLAVLALLVIMLRQTAPAESGYFTLVGLATYWTLWLTFNYIHPVEVSEELLLLGGFLAASLFLVIRMVIKRLSGILWFLSYSWIALTTAFATGYIFEHVLGDHQRTRIEVLFGMKDDPLGAGYNVNQSLIAIGSGGLMGKGFLKGTQTKLDFVPKQTTDFIFCTVGEEWGFLGSLALIAIYVTFFLRLIFLAEKQPSVFSRVYGYCVACIFFFHFTINICMTIGLMPVIGIPLPFFSYGGSSLWGFSVMLFIFLKLDTDRNVLIR